jgi:hypothetical protein
MVAKRWLSILGNVKPKMMNRSIIQKQGKKSLPIFAVSLTFIFLIIFCISFVSANSVAISGSTIITGNKDAAYIFTDNNGTWSQSAIFATTKATPISNVAISDNIAVIGDFWDGDMHRGSAHIFANNGTTWNQVTTLHSDDPKTGAWFGSHVAISGNTVVITEPHQYKKSGDAYIFTNSRGTWHQIAHLTGDNSTLQTAFGNSVAISGNTLIVGEPLADATHIFSNNNGTWKETARLTSPNHSSTGSFGGAVAISGNVAVIGEHWGGDKHQGDAYIFANNGKTWSLITTLSPKDWKGSDLNGGANFGSSVAIDGNNVIIGFPSAFGEREGTAIGQAGKVYLFTNTNGTWSQVAWLTVQHPTSEGYFGESLGISGNTIVVGGRDNRVRVFTLPSNTSSEIIGKDITSQQISQETPDSPTTNSTVSPTTQIKAPISLFPPLGAIGIFFFIQNIENSKKKK